MTQSSWEQRAHRALVAASDRATPSDAPPDADQIWAAVQGLLPARQARDVIDAAVLDPMAFVELRLALALIDELGAREHAPAVEPRRRALSIHRWGALVVALAAALLAVLTLRPHAPSSGLAADPGYRDVPAERLESSLPELAELPRDAFVLRWQGVQGARYNVSVSTEGAELIAHRRGVREPQLQIPSATLQPIPPGSKVLWRVEALLPDGTTRRSPTFVAVVQ